MSGYFSTSLPLGIGVGLSRGLTNAGQAGSCTGLDWKRGFSGRVAEPVKGIDTRQDASVRRLTPRLGQVV